MTQCTYLKPKQAFQFKNPATKRTVKIGVNETLWVMSSSTAPERKDNAIMIGRANATLGNGWYFTLQSATELFEVQA